MGGVRTIQAGKVPVNIYPPKNKPDLAHKVSAEAGKFGSMRYISVTTPLGNTEIRTDVGIENINESVDVYPGDTTSRILVKRGSGFDRQFNNQGGAYNTTYVTQRRIANQNGVTVTAVNDGESPESLVNPGQIKASIDPKQVFRLQGQGLSTSFKLPKGVTHVDVTALQRKSMNENPWYAIDLSNGESIFISKYLDVKHQELIGRTKIEGTLNGKEFKKIYDPQTGKMISPQSKF